MLLGYVPYFNKECCAFVGNVPPLTCVRVGPSARVLSPLSALSERARDFFFVRATILVEPLELCHGICMYM
jgi:hypothetical protein